jgi:hypothetical protein
VRGVKVGVRDSTDSREVLGQENEYCVGILDRGVSETQPDNILLIRPAVAQPSRIDYTSIDVDFYMLQMLTILE